MLGQLLSNFYYYTFVEKFVDQNGGGFKLGLLPIKNKKWFFDLLTINSYYLNQKNGFLKQNDVPRHF